MSNAVVIVGTGLAGYNLAKEFRKLDSQTPLIMISADDGRSYSKPMLSTGFAKNKSADELAMADAGAMAEQLSARILTHTRVTGIDPGHRRIWLGSEALEYRDLVLAWGAESLRVPVQGNAQDEILTLNDLEDYARLRERAQGKQRVLILGAGLIGCEIANDMRLGGYEVDMVAPCEQVMPTLLPSAAAQAVQSGLQQLGVRVHLGPILVSLERVGERLHAQLSDGQRLEVDLVLSAIGLRPRTELAQAAGLQVGRLSRSGRAQPPVRHAADGRCPGPGQNPEWHAHRCQLRAHAGHGENAGLPGGGGIAARPHAGRMADTRAGRRYPGRVSRHPGRAARLCPDRRGGAAQAGAQQTAAGAVALSAAPDCIHSCGFNRRAFCFQPGQL
jgi:thioredoxin reductase